MYCPNCKEVYGSFMIRHNSANRPVEVFINTKYCPVCGWHSENKEEEKPKNE